MRDDAQIQGRPFMKMHGAGNDFVVIDQRGDAPWVTAPLAKALGDRHRGVGFDQLAVIEAANDADFELIFYNPDGSISATCGNATRCIAAHEMAALGAETLKIRTGQRVLEARRSETGVAVNMGRPATEWDEIPLARDLDTLHLPIDGDPVATGMGNPHCTFFVDDAEAVALADFGAVHEHHPLYPERTNVEVVQILSDAVIRLRIWERGTGITLASGSCSCAAAVAAARRGLTGRKVDVHVDGGIIGIDWRDDGVWMSGPTAHVFTGTLTQAFLDAL